MDIVRLTIRRIVPYIFQTSCLSVKRASTIHQNRILGSCSIHTTRVKHDLKEFFDTENYDTTSIPTGRPWRKDELRIKSNADLHKLWYILLKERNLLLTMEHMYEEALEPFVNPERIFKVEESMENIVEVVKERNIAYDLLEQGNTNELPSTKVVRNAVGIPVEKEVKQHYTPKHSSSHYKRLYPDREPWMDKYMSLYEEKLRNKRCWQRNKYKKHKQALMEKFDLEEDNIAEYVETEDELQKHLDLMAELNDHAERK